MTTTGTEDKSTSESSDLASGVMVGLMCLAASFMTWLAMCKCPECRKRMAEGMKNRKKGAGDDVRSGTGS